MIEHRCLTTSYFEIIYCIWKETFEGQSATVGQKWYIKIVAMFSRLQSGSARCHQLSLCNRCSLAISRSRFQVGKFGRHMSWSYQSRKELSWPIYASKWNNSCCGLNDHMPNRLLLLYIYTHVAYTMFWPWQISWFFWVCCDFVRWRIPYPLIFQAGNCHGLLYPRQLDQRAYDSLDVHTSSWEVDVSGLPSGNLT